MKKALIYVCLLITGYVYGQQREHYSMYMMNNYLLNPAEGGTEEYIDLKMGYRTQWVGLSDNSPRTMFLSGHAPINKKTSRFEEVRPLPFHGAGGVIISDRIGVFDVLTAKASYSYHLPVTNDLTISFGAFLGIQQYRYDENRARYDKDEQKKDDVFNTSISTITPDASAGIWGYSKNYYFGLSSFQLLNNRVDLTNPGEAAANATATLSRHYFATAGYRIPLNENFNLIPSVVVRAVSPAPVQLDLNAKLRYQDVAWIGVSNRGFTPNSWDAIVVMVGITAKRMIDIAYSYDINLSGLKTYNRGSHEILVGLRLPNHEHEPPPSQFW